ncbi:MAG: PBP1A family penicillin-binding protein [Proteobacteria bacterium]|nr:PBP1A family penicillin-binding protein [Pseudomonadota bacterium]
MSPPPRRRRSSAPPPASGRPRATARRSVALRAILWLLGLGALAALLGGLALVGALLYYGADPRLPRISSLRDYRPRLLTTIVDRHGALLGELGQERRTVVPLERMPPLLVKAVVAAEDAAFFQHRGLDYLGMLRALGANLRAGHFVQGGSTITQQVVKTFFLTPERTIRRKIQEVLLAQRLEQELGKPEILALYLNQIYFGHGRYGVQEASSFFFGKEVAQLGLAECALLAGLPQAPQRLSPLRHPQRAKRRQTYVLRRMAELGFISPQVAQRLVAEPIRVVRRKRPYLGIAPEMMDLVRQRLLEAFPAERFDSLGLRVQTTIDGALQTSAREALRWGLEALDARHRWHEAKRAFSAAQQRRWRRRVGRQPAAGTPGAEVEGLVLAVNDRQRVLKVDLGARSAEISVEDPRYDAAGAPLSGRFVPGALVRLRVADAEQLVFDPGPQGALVALDPRSGDVLALVGGYDNQPGDFNRAIAALRQPGSAFKPFVYAAAIESGRFTAASLLEDAPAVYGSWAPRNFEDAYLGPVRLRYALAHSLNSVAVRLLDEVGVAPVRELARRLGISSALGGDLSLALGSYGVRPLELATAYAAFANGGRRIEPRMISRLGASAIAPAEAQPVLRPEVAYVVQNLMQSVVKEGTATGALALGRPVAGKTGTTNDHKDAWFVGFTPQLLVAVWVGFDNPRPLGRGETGGRAALPIWLRVMREALRLQPRLPFPQPPGVVQQRIDPQTGLLAGPDAVDALDEVFVQGTEPQEMAPPAEEVDPGTVMMDGSTP